ncbi:MAG: CRTAC1 family protein [Deltaproteobacteria bacterium]|nr:CRTAC1 family protein [Myxococcales bacterium]MDP3213186.1 CRTAC1 family protein [Deltaproteobacteria bacterium]
MNRRLRLSLSALVFAACSSNSNTPATDAAADATALADVPVDTGAPPPPPMACRAGTPWDRAAPAFRDATADYGLAELTAKRMATADLDNDGYADLVAWNDVVNTRTDFSLPPTGWLLRVLMNRPREGGAPGRRFVDATRESNFLALRDGTTGRGRLVTAVAFADVDNDGDLDAYTGTIPTAMPTATQDRDPGDRGTILLNDGRGVFTLGPVSDATPGPDDGAPQTIGAVFNDQNLDGNVDLLVGYHSATFGLPIGQQSQMFHGGGDGRFTDVTDAVGMTLESTSASLLTVSNNRPLYGISACDVNDDGRLDVIGAAYGRQFNLLMTSQGDTFRDESEASGVGGDDNRDFSDNQTYRCYCAAMPGRCPASVPAVGRGYTCPVRGEWRPTIDERPWRLNGNTFSIACGDVDNDGDVDLYTGEIAHPDVGANSDRAELLLNDTAAGSPTRFRRPGRMATGLVTPSGGGDEGVLSNAMFDFDNDGRLDIWAGGSDYPNQFGWLFAQGADGRFAEVSRAAGIRHACPLGVAWADFDHDGDVDMVVGTSTARTCGAAWMGRSVVRVYENVASEANWTTIRLVGRGPGGANRAAIGARVKITTGSVTQRRDVQGNWGLAGLGTELPLHVGLGSNCTIDRIEVRWPDAAHTVETFTDVRANYALEIVQGAGRVQYLR